MEAKTTVRCGIQQYFSFGADSLPSVKKKKADSLPSLVVEPHMFYCFQVEGIQGILTAYTSALYNVSLAGPTLFGRVVTVAADIASKARAEGQQKYYVLLIITVRYIKCRMYFCKEY